MKPGPGPGRPGPASESVLFHVIILNFKLHSLIIHSESGLVELFRVSLNVTYPGRLSHGVSDHHPSHDDDSEDHASASGRVPLAVTQAHWHHDGQLGCRGSGSVTVTVELLVLTVSLPVRLLGDH